MSGFVQAFGEESWNIVQADASPPAIGGLHGNE